MVAVWVAEENLLTSRLRHRVLAKRNALLFQAMFDDRQIIHFEGQMPVARLDRPSGSGMDSLTIKWICSP